MSKKCQPIFGTWIIHIGYTLYTHANPVFMRVASHIHTNSNYPAWIFHPKFWIIQPITYTQCMYTHLGVTPMTEAELKRLLEEFRQRLAELKED